MYFTNGWTHSEVKKYLSDHFSIKVCLRTLKYWKKRLKDPCWEHPKKPSPPRRKHLTEEEESKIILLRTRTGWGPKKIVSTGIVKVSHNTVRRVIKKNGLSRGNKIENKRLHWLKWQRAYPNDLWQIDSWQRPDGKWVIDVIDDRSRFCLDIGLIDNLTTENLISFLEKVIKIHGKPKKILTDNGAENGLKSKNSKFDVWCWIMGIDHDRTRPYHPTTTGKVERFHQTEQQELFFCNNDPELFRLRYNHFRPHESLDGKTPAEVYFSLKVMISNGKFKNGKWAKGVQNPLIYVENNINNSKKP